MHSPEPDAETASPTAAPPEDGWFRARHPWVARGAEVLALWGLTVSQPILDSFAGSPETFVYRRASTFDVVAFAVLVTLAVPLAVLGVEAVAARVWPPAQRWIHRLALAALLGLAGWQLVERNTDAGTAAHVAAVAALGIGGVVLLTRVSAARTVLRLLALSPLLVAVLWLGTGPVNRVAFADGPGTAAGIPVDDPAPVVLVVFDEFPVASLLDETGAIDETLFPSFARLAAGSTWYRNTASVSPTTPEAVPAILTGRYPSELGQPPTAATHPDNLFRALEGTYDLNVWELVTQLCPPEQCPAHGGATRQGLGALLGDAGDLWRDYVDQPPPGDEEAFAIRQSDPEAPADVERFIASIEGGDQLWFDFLHIPLPHQPWRHLPSGARHDAPFLAEGLDSGDHYSWKTDYFAEAGRQRHLLQLQRTDVLLGQLLRRLDDLDRYDDSLVVVTADHGVAFEAGEPIRGLSDANEEQVMWVPLFVKEPGQTEGAVDDRPLETVDIAPTIADILGVQLPWEVDGTSALAPRTAADDTRRFYPWKLNDLEPAAGTDHVSVDGAAVFPRVFEVPTAGGEPRDDLQLYRFGRWGGLVGREVRDLEVGEPAAVRAVLTDADDEPVGPDHFTTDLGQSVLPVYVRGELEGPLPADVVVAVNGFVGGWGEAFVRQGATRFFALTPQELFADGTNDIEVFTVTGEPGREVLHPVDVAWAR